MDDKLFELITKMYSEMQELKGDVSAIKTDLKETKSDVRKIYSKIENDVESKLEALFDGYGQAFELERQNSKKLHEIADQVTRQELEIKVMQGGKK